MKKCEKVAHHILNQKTDKILIIKIINKNETTHAK